MSDTDDASVAAVLEMAAKTEPSESILLFSLTKSQARVLAKRMVPVHVPNGSSPTHLCDTTCAVLVRAGSLLVTSDYAGCGNLELHRLAAGEMYGEYQLLSGCSSLTRVVAVGDDVFVSIISYQATLLPAFGHQVTKL